MELHIPGYKDFKVGIYWISPFKFKSVVKTSMKIYIITGPTKPGTQACE